MADVKSKVTISNDLIELFQDGGLRKAAAQQIASIVKEEFDEMLMDAPQYSGTYVANMMLGTSGIARRGEEFPFGKKKPKLADAYRRGQMSAVNFAKSRNEGFVTKATAHIMGKGGWIRELVVYNPLEKASVIENLDDPDLRFGGEHALAKMADRLRRRHALLDLRGLPK